MKPHSPGRKTNVARKFKRNESQVIGFLGVGLDGEEGHQRLTRSEHFLLVGGSEETHERMQDTVLRFDESLEVRGKKLHEASLEEILELFQKATEL